MGILINPLIHLPPGRELMLHTNLKKSDHGGDSGKAAADCAAKVCKKQNSGAVSTNKEGSSSKKSKGY